MIEVVGHLHRPVNIDPAKYPIRVAFNQDDLDDALDRGRLVTKVIYLEDPDSAIPLRMAKDQVGVLTISPAEPPLQVASGLGRPMAIVRLGGANPRPKTSIPTRSATSVWTGRPASARTAVPTCCKTATAAGFRAVRSAWYSRPRSGPSCLVTSFSATVVIAACRPRRPKAVASVELTRGMRCSASTSEPAASSGRGSCRPTSSVSDAAIRRGAGEHRDEPER